MKKFMVEVSQRAYRLGYYEIEAPDEDAAYILAEDINFDDKRIKWDEFSANTNNYPKPTEISITEVKE